MRSEARSLRRKAVGTQAKGSVFAKKGSENTSERQCRTADPPTHRSAGPLRCRSPRRTAAHTSQCISAWKGLSHTHVHAHTVDVCTVAWACADRCRKFRGHGERKLLCSGRTLSKTRRWPSAEKLLGSDAPLRSLTKPGCGDVLPPHRARGWFGSEALRSANARRGRTLEGG